MIPKFEGYTEVPGDAKFYKAEINDYAGWKLQLKFMQADNFL